MELEFRDLNPRDFDRAIDFACRGMNFDRFIKNKRVRYWYGKFFLYEEMRDASQVIALYDGDRLVGLLLANMREEAKAASTFSRSLYVAFAGLIAKPADRAYRKACARMLARYEISASPQGEISFLAVDPALQGKGLGSRMLDELAKREKGKLIYLFTDSNCTYEFYDRRGFVRVGETVLDMGGDPEKRLDCFLYAQTL